MIARDRVIAMIGFPLLSSCHLQHLFEEGIYQEIRKESLMAAKKQKRWVAKVTTDSTHPPKGLFTKSASTIARTLAVHRKAA